MLSALFSSMRRCSGPVTTPLETGQRETRPYATQPRIWEAGRPLGCPRSEQEGLLPVCKRDGGRASDDDDDKPMPRLLCSASVLCAHHVAGIQVAVGELEGLEAQVAVGDRLQPGFGCGRANVRRSRSERQRTTAASATLTTRLLAGLFSGRRARLRCVCVARGAGALRARVDSPGCGGPAAPSRTWT